MTYYVKIYSIGSHITPDFKIGNPLISYEIFN